MKLIFSDEFDYEGAPDATKWTHQVGGYWFNDEIQYYTDNLKNSHVKDGKLYIVALNEKKENRNHTSARITTHGKFSFKYGKIEMMAKLPNGKGSWPAFWMMPDSNKEGIHWPLCGEIDIVEYAAGTDESALHFTVHSQLYNHSIGTQETHIEYLPLPPTGFNKYTCEWQEDEISYFINNRPVARFFRDKCTDGSEKTQTEEAWPFNQNFYLILNLAVGGMFGGEVDDSQFPYVYEIEYVRVWQ